MKKKKLRARVFEVEGKLCVFDDWSSGHNLKMWMGVPVTEDINETTYFYVYTEEAQHRMVKMLLSAKEYDNSFVTDDKIKITEIFRWREIEKNAAEYKRVMTLMEV